MIRPHDTFLLWTRGTAVVPRNLNTVTDLQMNYSLLCRRNIFQVQEHLWLVLKLLQPRLGHNLWFFCWQSQDRQLSVLHAHHVHHSALLRESRVWLIRLEHGSASWTSLWNISSDSRQTDSWEVQFINTFRSSWIFTNHKYEQFRDAQWSVMSSPLLILKAVQQFETKTWKEAVTVQCLWRVLRSPTQEASSPPPNVSLQIQ